MGYFKNFKKVMYNLQGDTTELLTDLTSHVAVDASTLSNLYYFSEVKIEDGERPDQLSLRLYGTTQYYWIFPLINKNIINIWNDWPKSQRQLREYCQYKYPGVVITINQSDNYFNDPSFNEATNELTPLYVGQEVEGQITNARGKIRSIHLSAGYIVVDMIGDTQFNSGGEDIKKVNEQKLFNSYSITPHMDGPKYFTDIDTGDQVTPRAMITDNEGNTVMSGINITTHYEDESFYNDANRHIKVIRKEYIDEFVTKFNTTMAS